MRTLALGIAAVAIAAAIACSVEPGASSAPVGGDQTKAPGADLGHVAGPASRPTSRSEKGAGDCVGSCSAVKDEHPDLSTARYHQLVAAFAKQPLSNESSALETLLFHHDRTRALLREHGAVALDNQRAALLTREAERTHAWLDVRVVDETGKERIRLTPTRVPLGIKQHLWPEQRVALQPVEVSGTVKRVGLDHLWTRL